MQETLTLWQKNANNKWYKANEWETGISKRTTKTVWFFFTRTDIEYEPWQKLADRIVKYVSHPYNSYRIIRQKDNTIVYEVINNIK